MLSNIQQILLILLLTVVMGYFLGITVSSVVDYRLKDAVINLPRPQNKILVNLRKGDLVKEHFEVNSSSNSHSNSKSKGVQKKKVDNRRTNTEVNSVSSRQKNVQSQDQHKQVLGESFQSSETKKLSPSDKSVKKIGNNKKLDKKPEKKSSKEHFENPSAHRGGNVAGLLQVHTVDNPTRRELQKYYSSENEFQRQIEQQCPAIKNDIHRNAYAVAYQMAENMTQRDLQAFPFAGSNEEELDQQFETIARAPKIPSQLPKREMRCPQTKCQRPWMNCTDKHEIVNI